VRTGRKRFSGLPSVVGGTANATIVGNATVGSSFKFALPRAAVSDTQGATPQGELSVSAALEDGLPLPPWIKFADRDVTFNSDRVSVGSLPLKAKVEIKLRGELVRVIEAIVN
jgi:hypothetical protein